LEGEDDQGPATAQLTLLQIDLAFPPPDERKLLIFTHIGISEVIFAKQDGGRLALSWYCYGVEYSQHFLILCGWPLEQVRGIGGWRAYLHANGRVEGEKTIFIFDEARLSYEDVRLWGRVFQILIDSPWPLRSMALQVTPY
jgi:hypothetical protein